MNTTPSVPPEAAATAEDRPARTNEARSKRRAKTAPQRAKPQNPGTEAVPAAARAPQRARKAAPAAAPSAPAPEPAATAPFPGKLVRDSFTFPKDEYEALGALKKRLVALGHPAKKTEVLRAGLLALAALDDAALLTAARAVPVLRTGRPKRKH